MSTMLFGECLGKVVALSTHDVSEILETQAATRRRFGEIALSWGLCRPQHVWQAWWEQLAHHTPTVDLTRTGVDAQALAHVPPAVAREFRVVPLRCFDEQLVLATSEHALSRARAELPPLLGKHVRFALVLGDQLDAAIDAYYPASVPSAGAA